MSPTLSWSSTRFLLQFVTHYPMVCYESDNLFMCLDGNLWLPQGVHQECQGNIPMKRPRFDNLLLDGNTPRVAWAEGYNLLAGITSLFYRQRRCQEKVLPHLTVWSLLGLIPEKLKQTVTHQREACSDRSSAQQCDRLEPSSQTKFRSKASR